MRKGMAGNGERVIGEGVGVGFEGRGEREKKGEEWRHLCGIRGRGLNGRRVAASRGGT